MTTYRFQVLIEQDEDGYFIADVPALQAYYTQGRTFEEAMVNIREVISMCIEEMQEKGETINPDYPEIIGVKMLEIAV